MISNILSIHMNRRIIHLVLLLLMVTINLILQPRGLLGDNFRSKYEIIALHRCYMVPTLLPEDWLTIKRRQHAYKKLCAREKSFSLPEIFVLRLHRYLFAVTLIHTRIKKFFVKQRNGYNKFAVLVSKGTIKLSK